MKTIFRGLRKKTYSAAEVIDIINDVAFSMKFNLLDDDGQQKVLDTIKNLSENQAYRKEE